MGAQKFSPAMWSQHVPPSADPDADFGCSSSLKRDRIGVYIVLGIFLAEEKKYFEKLVFFFSHNRSSYTLKLFSMNREKVLVAPDGAHKAVSRDPEKAQVAVDTRPMTDVEILQQSWSKRAMIVAFVGYARTDHKFP